MQADLGRLFRVSGELAANGSDMLILWQLGPRSARRPSDPVDDLRGCGGKFSGYLHQSALYGSKITDEKSRKVNVMLFIGYKGRPDTGSIFKNRGLFFLSAATAYGGD